jgi:ribosomal protein S18 acetylase RimI-like enzyme
VGAPRTFIEGVRCSPAVSEDVVPLAVDLDAAARLGRAAILARPWIGSRGPELADQFERAVRAGDRSGGLYQPEGNPVGIAIWELHGPLGAIVNLLYLSPANASSVSYERFWNGLGPLAGPIAFAPGQIPGLSEAEEIELMESQGLARYGRSEMRRREGAEIPAPVLPVGAQLRLVGRADATELSRLHALAYHDRFDRYLFLEEDDEARDAARMVEEMFEGRWGAFSPEGSWGIEREGRLIGAVLCVRRPEGVLIADVMVEPDLQGQGIGKAVLLGGLRGLSSAGISPVYLNVTEGNDRAMRLYERLGFERTLGPSLDWYDPRRIPAVP